MPCIRSLHFSTGCLWSRFYQLEEVLRTFPGNKHSGSSLTQGRYRGDDLAALWHLASGPKLQTRKDGSPPYITPLASLYLTV
jgi:hypothetical protein